MKKGILSLLAWSLPILLMAQNNASTQSHLAENENGIQWATGLTWEQLKEKAKQENKFIFVDAYATWCGPCKKMDMDVYTHEDVGTSMSKQFISVKVQMDQTSIDNPQVKTWYATADELKRLYSIEGYPTFLFFSPDGKLVHKAIGYRNVSGFVALVKDALTDPEKRYIKSKEKFIEGLLDYASMPDFAMMAFDKKDVELATIVAKMYKTKYLDGLSDAEAFTKENLKIIMRFAPVLINSHDRYFKLFYTQPDLADSIVSDKISRLVASGIIKKEELYDKIYKDGKPISFPRPAWNEMKKSIESKYGKQYVKKIFPDEQIAFYQLYGDWKNYAKFVNGKIKEIPPQAEGNKFGFYGDPWTLNHYAWQLFLYCDDKKFLKEGLPWVDLAIKLDTTAYNDDYYDTKANLLYRMGKIKKAIELEEIAAARSNHTDRSVAENLRKMKGGLPTWGMKNK